MTKAKKSGRVNLEIVRGARGLERAERISYGTWMPRGAVHDKASRKSRRLDAKFKSAMEEK